MWLIQIVFFEIIVAENSYISFRDGLHPNFNPVLFSVYEILYLTNVLKSFRIKNIESMKMLWRTVNVMNWILFGFGLCFAGSLGAGF